MSRRAQPDVSPVLATFHRLWNDGPRYESLEQVIAHTAPLVGTFDDGHDEWRREQAALWLVTECAPAWLRLAGHDDHADKLVAASTWKERTVAAAEARDAADWNSTWDAAWDAEDADMVVDTAVDVAENVARAVSEAVDRAAATKAAWTVARRTDRAAATKAAWTDATDEARTIAEGVAWDVAWDAAWDVAKAAAGAANDAAGWAAARAAAVRASRHTAKAAAGTRLEPTVQALHASAQALYQRMVAGPGTA